MKMKKQINKRLVGIAILAIILSTISITFCNYRMLQVNVRNELSISAKLLKDTRYFESENINVDDINISTDADELRVTWIGTDGTVLYDNGADVKKLYNHSNRPEIKSAKKNGTGGAIRKSDTMKKNTFYYAVLLDNGTILRISTDVESMWSVFITTAPMLLIILLVIMVICIAISHMLTKQLVSPIEHMAEDIENVSKEPPYKELVPFINMIRKQHTDILSAAIARQDFTANVSHELKTPLTAISGYAELLENHMVDDSQKDHFYNEIRRNADRLVLMINDIIKLSELDRCETEPVFEKLDLYEIVSDCIDALRVNAQQKQIEIHFTGESVSVCGNKEMLRELVDNLVQNAIRYNNENGEVWIEVKMDNNPMLIVRDNGIGISKEDQSRVFERFYRVDKSRSRLTGGTGLGLAIVKHIVELHDAKINMESELGKGTRITITF